MRFFYLKMLVLFVFILTTGTASANEVKGYVYSKGVKENVYDNLPAYPVYPSDPYAKIPLEGNAPDEVGDIGNVIYFDGNMQPTGWYITIGDNTIKNGNLPSGRTGKTYVEKTDKGVIVGLYDPETGERYPDIHTNVTELYAQYKDPQLKKLLDIFDGTTKVKKETRYRSLFSDLLPIQSPYQTNFAQTYGLARENANTFAYTIGAKLGSTFGVPDLIQATAEISLQLNQSFSSKVTISSSTTVTRVLTLPAPNNPSYPHSVYRGGAYQLVTTYTVVPGNGLKRVLSDSSINLNYLANYQFTYYSDELYLTHTPGIYR